MIGILTNNFFLIKKNLVIGIPDQWLDIGYNYIYSTFIQISHIDHCYSKNFIFIIPFMCKVQVSHLVYTILDQPASLSSKYPWNVSIKPREKW